MRRNNSQFSFKWLIISIIAWGMFLAIGTALIKWISPIELNWDQSFWFSLLARIMFSLNSAYAELEERLGI